ncbi:VC0807 family protein [Actinomadura sp. DC4]|uniref:VC0807 family protein n=1 Tax=Actinomadura sp. DC4 TaxID=3055069 RepID=UPI0025B06F20|nr:VC0807 family protein [Actinomadura sp. DC4]MDN3353178.1 VC0807 family protein [Actinomadura sp. DC4]
MTLGRSAWLCRLLLSVAVNGAVPVATYALLRAPMHSDAGALAVGAGAPLVWSLGFAAWRRRPDPLGLLALAGLGIALMISLLVGGGSLPLLLRHVAVTGGAGLACLISVLIGHPLLAGVRPLLLRRFPPAPSPVRRSRTSAAQGPYFSVLTATVGVVLLAHAAANIVLALTLPTGRYLLVSRVVGWAVTGIGAVLVVGYVKCVRRA